MGDAQDRMSTADAGDLDPAEAYRLVFEAVGWTGADIEDAINDAGKSLEGQLYDQVGSKSYAASLLKDALATVEARMLEANAESAPRP
jgi:hypothetical protein